MVEGGTQRMAHHAASYDLSIEEPDILVAHYRGHFDGPDVKAVLAAEKKVIGNKPYVFVLGNIANLQGVTANGRRVAALATGELPIAGIILHGASYPIRVLLGLLFSAGARLGALPMPISFSATETEARQWIAARRSEHLIKTNRGGLPRT